MKKENDFARISNEIEAGSAVEAAATMEELPPKRAAEVAQRLELRSAANVISRMDSAQAAQVVGKMSVTTAAQVLAAMEPDDRVDCLRKMPRNLHETLVEQMAPSQRAETRQLEQYPSNTAGGIMTTQYTALPQDLNVEQAIAELRRIHAENASMFYVYVVDPRRCLVGVLSMRDLILAPPDRPLNQVMIANVKSVRANTDREEVARFMRESRYLALPVIDPDDHLIGLITLDDVVKVIQEEATEDVQRMCGAGAEERLASPWQFSFAKRIGWLQVNLGTAFLAGAVVTIFGSTIGRFAVLAVYMPIVSGMGGNAAAQAMSVSIRGISSGSSRRHDRRLLGHVLRREAIVGFLTGTIVGITTAIIAWIWEYKHGSALGLIVCMALVITQTLACVSGAGIPFVMRKLGFDPAQSATIFATTVTDVTGLASLLGLATLFQAWLR
ncbi:MAG: magnesium transporter [Tepidisphaeraceae bacterium]|jgi:magnesium transporter